MKIVIAIHGIGDQRICETIRRVTTQYGKLCEPIRPEQPLGFFNLADGGATALSSVEGCPMRNLPPIGVAEVYWADLPRDLAKRDDTMDESRAWARTVAGRAQLAYDQNMTATGGKLTLKDRNFVRAAGVIEEIAEGVGVLENLTLLASKAGIFHFNLGALLDDYVGGIQLPADFEFYRDTILTRFHDTLTRAVDRVMASDDGPPEIYIVAHSEGTVISFAAIMQALLQPQSQPSGSALAKTMEWVKHVHGYMTIGCPLDKHILLWPTLWEQIGLNLPPLQAQLPAGKFIELPQKIKWHNYYDYADPVAFDVSEARKYLHYLNCTAFNYQDVKDPTATADYGFSRYPWPGEAHVQYWDDDEVFEHFFFNVMLADTDAKLEKRTIFGVSPVSTPLAPPRSKLSARLLALIVPYALVFIILLLGVSLLVTAVNDAVAKPMSFGAASTTVIGLTIQLAGMTIAARLPRIRGGAFRQPQIVIMAIVALALGDYCAWRLVGATPIGSVFDYFVDLVQALWAARGHITELSLPKAASSASSTHAGAALAALCGLTAIVSGWIGHGPRAGRTWLIGLGASWMALVLLTVFVKFGVKYESLWRVSLCAGAYFYLWWLGIVLFDLSYIWRYYIRRSKVVTTLRAWASGKTWPA